MERVSVRKAKSTGDFEQVEQLCRKAFPSDEVALAASDLHRCSSDEFFTCLLATDNYDDSVAGCVFLLDTPVMYEKLQLPACELNFLASRPDMSGTGVASALINKLSEESKSKGYVAVFLEGIPHYYRRHGFDYAVPLQKQYLDLRESDLPCDSNYTLRDAELQDVDFIRNCREGGAETTGLMSVLSEPLLKRQINCYGSSLLRVDYLLIESDGKPVGYVAVEPSEHEVIVLDIGGAVSFSCMNSLITHLVKTRVERVGEKNRITFRLAEHAKPHTYLRMLGATEESNYARQVKIIDTERLFELIRPVLERRVRNSCFAEEMVEFQLNDFRNRYEISFSCSRMSFEKREFELTTEFNLPHQALVKLVFGDTDYWSIKKILPDCHIDKRLIPFAEILFPRMNHSVFRSF